ncbi:endolytic transglycosylase MltG [Roseovarius sp. CAU 1744]|uniref:endolytic transglycosylase MltG n=1 Tax=Roseovarius sp. CAU 1744 TaxID=3140368 RepID=UPI00325B53BA
MWRHIASNALTFLVVLAFLLGGVILWGQNEYTTQGPLQDRVCLRVESGATMRGVSRQLQELGAVSNASIYRIGAEYSGKNSQLKAGSWLVPERASMQEIVDIVTRGGASTCGTEVVFRIGVTQSEAQVRELDPATDEFVMRAEFTLGEGDPPEIYRDVRSESDTRYRIAIAEGVTSWQIVNSLNQIDVLEGEIAEQPPEGSLAPDSYEVRVGDTRESLVERMDAAQDVLLAAAWENRAEGIPLNDPYEALILASIIEKETGQPEERGQVASVFTNRLRQGMKLQTDPTVIYGITKGQGVLGRGLRQSELRNRTDWNTYVIDGLPPTPIANPGRASLEAAVNPDATDYIFFVADGTGGHAFATTLEEHNKNVAEWRKIEAERAAEQATE